MIEVLRPVSGPDPAPRAPAVFRSGLRAARQELRAGSARRRQPDAGLDRPDPEQPVGQQPVGDHHDPAPWSAPVPRSPRGAGAARSTVEPAGPPAPDLATQRAGVRAALDELRQHRGHR